MPDIRIRSLVKTYMLEGRPVPVIGGPGLDLDISCSEITVVVGRSGCGKTTLLKLVAGLERPTSGSIVLPEGLRTGVVFQEDRLMPWLTTEKNIAFGLGRGADREKIASLVALVGLAGFEKAYPAQLSGGMRQRAAIARALAIGSDMLLMDEPFAALDYFTRTAMQGELIRIRDARGVGVLMVTHNLDEALLLGDRLVFMEPGGGTADFRLPGPREGRDIFSGPFTDIRRTVLAMLKHSN